MQAARRLMGFDIVSAKAAIGEYTLRAQDFDCIER
jgi:hypothetical protein